MVGVSRAATIHDYYARVSSGPVAMKRKPSRRGGGNVGNDDDELHRSGGNESDGNWNGNPF